MRQLIYTMGHSSLPALNECLCPECSRISSFTLAAVEVTLSPLLSDLLNCVAVSFLPSSCGRGSVEHAALIHEGHPTLRSLFRLQCPWLPGQLFLPSPPCRAFYIKKKKNCRQFHSEESLSAYRETDRISFPPAPKFPDKVLANLVIQRK